MKNLITLLLILALATTFIYLSGASSYEHIPSNTGCCSIYVDHNKMEVIYTSVQATYTDYADNKEDLEDLIESYKEYCYDHHYVNTRVHPRSL